MGHHKEQNKCDEKRAWHNKHIIQMDKSQKIATDSVVYWREMSWNKKKTRDFVKLRVMFRAI